MNKLTFYSIYEEKYKIHNDISLYRSIFILNDFDEFILKDSFLNCCGVDNDPEVANAKAYSEAVERLYMNMYTIKVEEIGSLNLDDSQINIPNNNFLKDKISRTDFIKALKLDWCGKELNYIETVIPEQLVNFRRESLEDVFYPISSNGFSAHPNFNKSIENGILECYERDIVLRFFATLNLTETYTLISDEILKRYNDIYLIKNSMIQEGWSVKFLYLKNSYGLSCVVVWAFHLSTFEHIFAAAANICFDEALMSTFREMMSNFKLNKNKSDNKLNKNSDKINKINHLFDSLNTEVLREEDIENGKRIDLKELVTMNETYIKEFTDKRFFNVTNRYVIRTIIPGLIYYHNKETIYLKKIKNRNILFNEFGIFSPYEI